MTVEFFLETDGAFEKLGEPADGGGNLGCFIEAELAEFLALGRVPLRQLGHGHDYGDIVIHGVANRAKILIQRFHLPVQLVQLPVTVLDSALGEFRCGGFHVSLVSLVSLC